MNVILRCPLNFRLPHFLPPRHHPRADGERGQSVTREFLGAQILRKAKAHLCSPRFPKFRDDAHGGVAMMNYGRYLQ